VATYVAGSLADEDVTDVVQARVTSSGSANAVIITVNPVKTTTTLSPIQETVAADEPEM